MQFLKSARWMVFDQLSRVSYFCFIFLSPPPPDGSEKGFSPRLQRLGEVDVTGRCLLTRFIKTDWKHGIPFWSQPTPETCPSHARLGSSACAREIHRRGGEQKYWGLFSVRRRVVDIGACLTRHKTRRQWLCCVSPWHLTRISAFQIAIYEYWQPARPWWLT